MEMSIFAATILGNKYAHTKASGNKESWEEIAYRVGHSVMDPYLPRLTDKVTGYITSRKFMPGGRYLSSCGRKDPFCNNCYLLSVEDTSDGWARLMYRATAALMHGGGIGVVYSKIRPEGQPLLSKGGVSTGPCALMNMVNEAGRHIMQGGSRRSAIWAGLHWTHRDIFKFIRCKQWDDTIKQLKAKDYSFRADMDGTNISVILDDAFFSAYNDSNHPDNALANRVYWETVAGMLRDGEPGFSIDIGENEGENLRNACCEVVSRDDGDMCNLGSINLARIDSPEELAEVTETCTAFLLCGTLYSKLPIDEMYKVREKNRRIGLGLMGVHEWLLKRGYRYEPNVELEDWLRVYAMSGAFANRYADKLSISRPVATRSVAPTGTISIVAETTSGIEPIYATAYKRRYLDGKDWMAQYVVDATANRLIERGVDPNLIEDAYDLSQDVERRVRLQSFVQRYVDHAISSTINLPQWGTSVNNEDTVKPFGGNLMKYLPYLRGITAYPDGSRGGQPLTKVPYSEAIRQVGIIFEDNSDKACTSGVCAS